MKKIEEYINFICKNTRGTKKEIEELKQEMRSHLTQTVQELIADGKTEQESIELAIGRFGEKNQIQGELAKIFTFQKKLTKVILSFALIFFVLGISSAILDVMDNQRINISAPIFAEESNKISDVVKTNNLDLLDKTVRDLLSVTDNKITYVVLGKFPDKFDPKSLPFSNTTWPKYQGEIEYQYPENIQNVQKSGMIASGLTIMSGSEYKYYLEIGSKDYAISKKVPFAAIVGIGFCMLYWVLFGIWATINAYHTKRLNVAWEIIFFVLNVAGYLLHKIYYWFKVDRVA